MKFANVLLIWSVLCTALSAEETWMYPVLSPGSSGVHKSNDVRIADYSTQVIDREFATFDEILKWYCDRIGSATVSDALIKYKKRPSDAADVHHGSAIARNGDSGRTTIVTYVFTPTHSQITMLHPVEAGGVLAISLLGTEQNTGIQIIRRHREVPAANN